ncbi:hypothetical protein M378DRAFT_50209, partial [Amanita muscaria Koide BX008]
KIWDAATGTPISTIPGHRSAKLAFSSGSSRVAAALSDGSIRLWDSGNAELKTSIFDEFEGRGQLEFSPSGTRLAYSSTNGIVKLRDGISGEFIADLQCGLRRDLYFTFSDDGSQIASLSRAHGLKLWNSESGKLAILFHIYPQSRQCHTETVTALGFGPDDRLFASGSGDGTIKLWSGGNGALYGTLQ